MPKNKEEKLIEEETKTIESTEASVADSETTPDEADKSITEAEIAASDVEVQQVIENVEVDNNTQNEVATDETVTIQPIKFASFDDLNPAQGEANKNLDILMDIKLQLTVELGRTELPIKKVLELTRGSIIELEKIAGEPVELYANGKLIAHGEVVVIEDNFGLRITSITEPEDRLRGV